MVFINTFEGEIKMDKEQLQKNSNELLQDEEYLEALMEVKKRKKKEKIIFLSIIATIVVGLLIVIWAGGYNYSKKKSKAEIDKLKEYIEQLEETPIISEEVTSEIVMRSITENMADISELATAEYLFTNCDTFKDNKVSWLPNWVAGKSFTLKWDGIIKAGIDVSKISITVEESKIKVSLPRAEILSYEVDFNSVEVLEEKNGIFNHISLEDKVGFDQNTAEFMKLRAVGNGLMEKAQTNAENIIKNIISSVENTENYTIEFTINYN